MCTLVVDRFGGDFERDTLKEFFVVLKRAAEDAGPECEQAFPRSQRALKAWLEGDAKVLEAVGIEFTHRKVRGQRRYGLRTAGLPDVRLEEEDCDA